jgi:hypothetical protein
MDGFTLVQQQVMEQLITSNIPQLDACELILSVCKPGQEIVSRPGQPPLKPSEESLLGLVSA